MKYCYYQSYIEQLVPGNSFQSINFNVSALMIVSILSGSSSNVVIISNIIPEYRYQTAGVTEVWIRSIWSSKEVTYNL